MALTKLNNKSVANVSTLPVALGDMVLVSSATASGSASIEFSLGNYKEYKFFFVNMHPSVDNAGLYFQTSTDNGLNYNTTLTSTFFYAYHFESDTPTALGYDASMDQANGTSFQRLIDAIGFEADESGVGSMQLFNPSSTTYVKHYLSNCNSYVDGTFTTNYYSAGYFNTTSALTNIKFQMSSGNIDAGTILMYGIN